MNNYHIEPHLWLKFLQHIAEKNQLTSADVSTDLAIGKSAAIKLMKATFTLIPDFFLTTVPSPKGGRNLHCLMRYPNTTALSDQYYVVLDQARQALTDRRIPRIFAYLADKNDISSNDLVREFNIPRNLCPWYFDRIMREYPGEWRKIPLQQAGAGRPYMMLARIKPAP